jgi:nucleoside-diphosphate-sugar epimerase
MKTVLITGATGFIAGHLARAMSSAGYRVLGTSRSGAEVADFAKVFRASLGDSIVDFVASEEITAVVHAANYVGDNEFNINYEGTRQWFNEARDAGIDLQILLSSLSASEDAISAYGKTKFALESTFSAANQLSLRLGLVVGNGGMFERIRRSVGSGIIVPMLDNGNALVYVLGIDFLCTVVAEMISNNDSDRRGQTWSIQQPEACTLRELMESIRRQYGYHCVFLPMPSLPILWALTLAERLPLNLPVQTTHIKGLRQSRHQTFSSHFDSFGHSAQSLDALVARAHELDNA